MTADPALGDYMPGAGKTVGYLSPALANKWRSYPDRNPESFNTLYQK
jgi:hypothetical protein